MHTVKLLPSTSKSTLVRLVNFEPMEGALLHTMLYFLTNLQIWGLDHSLNSITLQVCSELYLEHCYLDFLCYIGPGMLFLLVFSPSNIFFLTEVFLEGFFFRGYCWPHILNKLFFHLAHPRCFRVYWYSLTDM